MTVSRRLYKVFYVAYNCIMPRKPKVEFQANINAVKGSGARCLYQHHSGAMHKIEFSFIDENGKQYTVTMNHDAAREFINSSIAAYQAIMEPLRIARQVPFGG